MIKLVITAAIIYFIVRSIANKPWKQEIHIHQPKSPDKKREQSMSSPDRGEFTDYEEVD